MRQCYLLSQATYEYIISIYKNHSYLRTLFPIRGPTLYTISCGVLYNRIGLCVSQQCYRYTHPSSMLPSTLLLLGNIFNNPGVKTLPPEMLVKWVELVWTKYCPVPLCAHNWSKKGRNQSYVSRVYNSTRLLCFIL